MSTFVLDIGNESTVGSVLTSRGTPQIIQDETSKRLVPSIFSLTDRRYFTGDLAQQMQSQNIESTVTHIKSLIGLKYTSKEREVIEKRIPFNLEILPDHFTGISLIYDDNKIIMNPIEVLAFLIEESIKRAETFTGTTFNPSNLKLFYITEPWWSQVERQMIIDACQIINISNIKLINSTTSAAVNFLNDHQKIIPDSPKNALITCFIDIGESSLSLSAFRLSKNYVETIDHFSDESFGGEDFTFTLVDLILGKIVEKYKNFDVNEIRNNKKQFERFKREVEKIKKALSVNQTMLFTFHTFSDFDISLTIQRTEFEQCSAALIERFEKFLIETNKKLGMVLQKDQKISFVELIGGSTRIPIVKQTVSKVFKIEIRQSMNADECVAQGSAYLINPLIKVNDLSNKTLILSYEAPSGNRVTKIFFKKGTRLTFKTKQTISIKGNVINILNSKGIIFNIILKDNAPSYEKLQISASLDLNGLLIIDDIIDLQMNKSVHFVIEKRFSPVDQIQLKQMQTFHQTVYFRECSAKKSEDLKNKLEVELMKRKERTTVHDWFEEHEFDLFDPSVYQHYLNILSSGYANIDQVKTIQSRLSKLLEATEANPQKQEIKDLSSEILDLIIYVSSNEKQLVYSEIDEKVKKLEQKMKSL